MSTQEPPYLSIARRKQAERESRIPRAWRLPESLTASPPLNVMDIPRKCGILTERQLEITEGKRWDGQGLVEEMGKGGMTAEEVVEAFCTVSNPTGQFTTVSACLTVRFWLQCFSAIGFPCCAVSVATLLQPIPYSAF